MTRKALCVLIPAAVLFFAGCSGGGERHSGGHDEKQTEEHAYKHSGEGGHHHSFEDAEKWAKVFESEDRDEWQKPDRVIEILDPAPEAKVADIGASTGYFPVRFARAVPEGKVYGVDIEPEMTAYLRERAEREGLSNLVSVLGEPADPKIPEPVDLIFLCNTYHHIGDRTSYFASRLDDLKPAGRLAIVDFLPGELPIGPPPAMKIPPEGVIAEMEKAGYRLADTDESLPYQFFMIFEPGE